MNTTAAGFATLLVLLFSGLGISVAREYAICKAVGEELSIVTHYNPIDKCYYSAFGTEIKVDLE